MAVTIRPNFSIDDIKGRFDAFLETISELELEALKQLGEECVTYARSDHANNWMDRSGNLRSSIGYGIFHNGEPVFLSSFETENPSEAPKDGIPLDGGNQGRELCCDIGGATTGNTLVVVAGMNYAVYVEAKGRDVLTGAEALAARRLPMMIDQLQNDIKSITQ